MTVKVGLCGFTVGLEDYPRRLPVVEVQQTFYEPPRLETVRGWRARARPGLELTMKAWQLVTHAGTSRTYRRMRRPLSEAERAGCGSFRDTDVVAEGWRTTLLCARALSATAVLFQCPPSFRPTPENAANLRGFFERVGVDRDPGVRFLWEPRGAWPGDLVADLCAAADLVHVVDPFAGLPATRGFTYFRLHGRGRDGPPPAYTDEELAALLAWLPPEAREGAEPAYAMFNNIPRVRDAARFLERLPAAAPPAEPGAPPREARSPR